VALIGSNEMMAPGSSNIRRARLKVIFGEPIAFSRAASREEILKTIMREIACLMSAHGVPSVAAEDRVEEGRNKMLKSVPR
jgi:hypothetical protein